MNAFKITLLLSYICIASLSAAIITPALPHIQAYFDLSIESTLNLSELVDRINWMAYYILSPAP